MFLTGCKNNIKQWKLQGDNINLHNSYTNYLLNMGNGHIASGSEDNTIKIW